MLRADRFALTAGDAVAGLAKDGGQVLIVLALGSPAFGGNLLLVGVVEGEVLGNRDVHRTSFGAVGAGGAGTRDVGVDDADNLVDDGVLFLGEGL